jgi:H+/Cl- antiporter ClcA
VGNGNLVLNWVVNYGADQHPLLDRNLLLCTGFSRMFIVAVSMRSGFVGGFVFPTLTIGLFAAVIMSQMFDYIPLGLCASCFFVSITAGIVPMPITLSVLSTFVFYLGEFDFSEF